VADSPSAARDDEVSLGYVSGVFGVSGEVRLYLHNRESELLSRPREVVLAAADGQRSPVRLRTRAGAGGRVLGEIEGVSTPEAANRLIHCEILIPRAELPRLGPDTWYQADLLGLPVYDASGRLVGTLTEVHGAGGTDVWLIQGPEGETYIPALKANLVAVRPGDRIIVTDEAVPEIL
jgi:16S rRNA processing protein RimM